MKFRVYDKYSKKYIDHCFIDPSGKVWINIDPYGAAMNSILNIKIGEYNRYKIEYDGKQV